MDRYFQGCVLYALVYAYLLFGIVLYVLKMLAENPAMIVAAVVMVILVLLWWAYS